MWVVQLSCIKGQWNAPFDACFNAHTIERTTLQTKHLDLHLCCDTCVVILVLCWLKDAYLNAIPVSLSVNLHRIIFSEMKHIWVLGYVQSVESNAMQTFHIGMHIPTQIVKAFF